MSTPFYDLASLVVVPSGYKASKVYAQKPLTTDGQLAFTRSTTATRVNSAGLIEASAINVPRLDYLNSTCPKLLLEPSRTNGALHSSAFDNGAWAKLDTSVTANAGTSPDGSSNADKIVPNTTNARHILYQSISASTAHTYSVFAKAAGQNFLTMRLDDDTPEVNVYFNLSTGTIGATAGGSPTITSYGNGWYRCSVTYTPSGTETIYAVLGSANIDGTLAYAGNGTDGILVYGAQLEAGAYATSYIPTLGAAVTRGADATLKTGISSLIGTEFTLFYDGFETTGGTSTRYIGLKGTGGTYANLLLVEGSASNSIAVTFLDNSAANVINFGTASLTNGQRFKLALRCKNNSFALYLNGSLVSSQASGSVPTTSDLYLGYYTDYSDSYSLVNQAIIFPTGLTNVQLAELTTI